MSSKSSENVASRASLDLLYHISRELAGTQDLRAILERVLFLSMRNVGAMSGSIIVLDDTGKPVESAIINGEVIMKDTTQQLRIMMERGLAGWVIRSRQPALVKDTNNDERWMVRQFEGEKQVESRSAVSAPLFVRERLVGVMTLVHRSAGFFNDDHLSLFQAIADQASIAVLNARLYGESQRQARVMTALAETAATITGSLNLEDVLLRIMEQTHQALAVQAVSLSLLEPATNDLIVRAAIGWNNKNVVNARIKNGQGVAGWVVREGRGVIINDVSKDPRYHIETDRRTGLATKAIACAPLRYRSQVIGVLEAINPSNNGTFDADALLVLSGISSLAGTTVRHAQLFERLQAAHQSYRELFEDSIDPILITDWNGRIIEANRMAVLASEYDKNILSEMNIGHIHEPNNGLLGNQFENLRDGKTLSYEAHLHSQTGHELPIEVHVHQVMIEGNAHIQWILRDITERKNLDSMREDLISMIYHDLRSPLANVASSLDVLDSMLPENDDENIRSLLNIAMRSVERIQRLTNSLLDMSRLEAGQQVGNRQPTNILEIIEDAAALVRPVASAKQQSLFTELPYELPDVMVDGEMIRRAISNLLENATKYSPSGSTIEVGAQALEDTVQVWVKDNGPGIPASEQTRVFNKFTRLGTKEKAKGLGLGLAYCKLAIEAHGGRIWIESEPGQGSNFIFSLPIETS